MDIKMPVPDPAKSVAKIASKVNAGEKTRRRALEILAKARESGVAAGKDPVGLAASALYVASTLSGEDKTQRDIAKAAGVTEVTIRNRYKNLRAALKI
jgi:transcription initiation factor TFIIB